MTVQKQLLGRRLYGPQVAMGPGISPLWQFFRSPPAQNSVIIYDDGHVVERQTFENSEIQADNVVTFILGGTDFRTDDGSSGRHKIGRSPYTA